MDRRYLNGLTSVLYFICIVAVMGMVGHAFNIFSFKHGEKLILGIIIVISGYTAGCFRCLLFEEKKRFKIIKRHLAIIFIFYIIMLIDFTLIDDSLGRNIYNVLKWDETAFQRYMKESTNLVPFTTVKLFIKGYMNNQLTFISMIENVLGNFMVLMPLPFFLTIFTKSCKKWYCIFAYVLITVVVIEFLQFIFLTGSSDIDDVILNVVGAMGFYALLKIKSVSKGISKLTFGVWKTVEN